MPLAESGGAVIEVNTTPGFHYHYHKNDGSFPVAVRVLEQLLRDFQEKAAARARSGGPDGQPLSQTFM